MAQIFNRLIHQKIYPLVLPAMSKGPPVKGWPKAPLMPSHDADLNDTLLGNNQCNIAIGLGISGLVAVDIDVQSPELVDMLFSEIQQSPAIKLGAKGFTCIYKSDGSTHKSWLLPETLRNKIGEAKAKVEFLAGNHYTILPPSIHPDTLQPYQWVSQDQELVLENLPVFDKEKFIVLLDSLGIDASDWAATKKPDAPVVHGENGIAQVYVQGLYQDNAEVLGLIKQCLDNISPDITNQEWIDVGYSLNHSISGEAGAKLFSEWSAKSPQWAENLTVNQSRTNTLFFANAPTNSKQKTILSLIKIAEKSPAWLVTPEQSALISKLKGEVPAAAMDIGDLDAPAVEPAPPFVEKYKLPEWANITSDLAQVEMVRQAMGDNIVTDGESTYTFSTVTKTWKNATRYGCDVVDKYYNDTIQYLMEHPLVIDTFRVANNAISPTKARAFHNQVSSCARINAVTKKVVKGQENLRRVSPDIFDSLKDQIGLADSTKLNLKTGECTPIVANDYVTKLLPCTLPQLGGYGRIIGILKDIFSENENPQEMLTYIQGLMGYFLSGDVSRQEVYCLVGSGSNGKSLFTSILKELMGANAKIVNFDIFVKTKQTTDYNRMLSEFIGRRLIIVDDMADDNVWSDGLIKTITNDRISAREIYTQGGEFVNHAKVVFGCNDIPKLSRASMPMQRRIICIPFNRTFESNTYVRNQLDKIVKEDIEGLLQWALDGSIRNHTHPEANNLPASVKSAISDYIQDTDPLIDIVDQACSGAGTTDSFQSYDEIRGVLLEWLQYLNKENYHHMDIEMLLSSKNIRAHLAPKGYKSPISVRKVDGKVVRGMYVDLTRPEFVSDIPTGGDFLNLIGQSAHN